MIKSPFQRPVAASTVAGPDANRRANRSTPMNRAGVHDLVRDVVREVALGRYLAAGTEFSRIGIGPWQRQRFFGPLRDAFNRRGLDVTGRGLERESFMHYHTLGEVQAAIWESVRQCRGLGASP